MGIKCCQLPLFDIFKIFLSSQLKWLQTKSQSCQYYSALLKWAWKNKPKFMSARRTWQPRSGTKSVE